MPFVELILLVGYLTMVSVSRLRAFENKVLRRKFGSKMGGITGGRRKLHNEELHS
jgi:hypothetical protein